VREVRSAPLPAADLSSVARATRFEGQGVSQRAEVSLAGG
jgi:hypothetical protein